MSNYFDLDWLSKYLANIDGKNLFIKSNKVFSIAENNKSDMVDIMTRARLPIDDFREEIEKALDENQVLVITAETWSWKTTETPLFFLKKWYEVVVTQPRRVAVESVPRYVCDKVWIKLWWLIWFRHGMNSVDSEDTRLLYCTDWLQMVREIIWKWLKWKSVLVIDEVHEWNTNIETLLAWSKQKIKENPEFKVVIMSATFDASRMQDYFNYDLDKPTKSKVIDIPGKIYPVETVDKEEEEYLTSIIQEAEQWHNILAFRSGKKDIYDTVWEIEEELKSRWIRAMVLPLHWELPYNKQELIFKNYNIPKIIVSTNIAQTSITIDDIDVVVDDGKEKQILVDNNWIEWLFTVNTSKADCLQRKWRAWRCKPGKYILCAERKIEDRSQYSTPEIERVRLDQLVLRLFDAWYDPTKLDFFHQPPREQIENAKKTLIELWALTQDWNITEIGKYMSELPVDVHVARMIVESFKYWCVDDVLKIAACMQVKWIQDRQKILLNVTWNWPEKESDAFLQLQLFNLADQFEKKADRDWLINGSKERFLIQNLEEKWILLKKFRQACLIYRDLDDKMVKFKNRFKDIIHSNDAYDTRESILKSVLSWMRDNVFIKDRRGYLNINNINDETRQIDKNSVIVDGGHQIVCGTPWNMPIKIQTRYGWEYSKTLNLINMCTWLNEQSLKKYLPDLEIKEIISDNIPKWNKIEWHFELVVQKMLKDYSLWMFTKKYFPTSEEERTKYSQEFCKKLCELDFESKDETFNDLWNDISKIMIYNNNLLKISRKYNVWTNGKYERMDNDYIINHFYETLKSKNIYCADDFIAWYGKDYFFDDFKIDLEHFYGDDKYKKLKEEFKTEITIWTVKYDIMYNNYFEKFVDMSVEEFIKLHEIDINGFKNDLNYIRIKYNQFNLETGNLVSTKQTVISSYEDDLFLKFRSNNKDFFKLESFVSLQLPKPTIYSNLTWAIAYPYFAIVDDLDYELYRTRDKSEADREQNVFLKTKDQIDKKNIHTSDDFNFSSLSKWNMEILEDTLIKYSKDKNLTFILFENMSEDELFDEFERLEKIIKLINAIPWLFGIDENINTKQQELDKFEEELPWMINQRDLSTWDKKEKLKKRVLDIQEKKKELKSDIDLLTKTKNKNRLLLDNYTKLQKRYDEITKIL